MTAAQSAAQADPMAAAGAHIQLFAGTRSGPVRWRLLSRNNREIARSIAGFDTVTACAGAVGELRDQLSGAHASIRRTESHAWVWELSLAGVPCVAGGRRFDRMIRCQQGLDSFLALMVDAAIGPRLMVSSDRRWGDTSVGAGVVRPRRRPGEPQVGTVAVRPSFTGIPPS